jgi:hypothetical protein
MTLALRILEVRLTQVAHGDAEAKVSLWRSGERIEAAPQATKPLPAGCELAVGRLHFAYFCNERTGWGGRRNVAR